MKNSTKNVKKIKDFNLPWKIYLGKIVHIPLHVATDPKEDSK